MGELGQAGEEFNTRTTCIAGGFFDVSLVVILVWYQFCGGKCPPIARSIYDVNYLSIIRGKGMGGAMIAKGLMKYLFVLF